jgi:hypothetical protein
MSKTLCVVLSVACRQCFRTQEGKFFLGVSCIDTLSVYHNLINQQYRSKVMVIINPYRITDQNGLMRLDDFYIAGVQYSEAAFVMEQLRPGITLDILPEPDNPYDSQAVIILHQGAKLGYIPRKHDNGLWFKLLMGGTPLQCRVLSVNQQEEVYRQVRVGLYIRGMETEYRQVDPVPASSAVAV